MSAFVTYAVADFGAADMRCADCDRDLPDGYPYDTRIVPNPGPTATLGAAIGAQVVHAVCVYCAVAP